MMMLEQPEEFARVEVVKRVTCRVDGTNRKGEYDKARIYERSAAYYMSAYTKKGGTFNREL